MDLLIYPQPGVAYENLHADLRVTDVAPGLVWFWYSAYGSLPYKAVLTLDRFRLLTHDFKRTY